MTSTAMRVGRILFLLLCGMGPLVSKAQFLPIGNAGNDACGVLFTDGEGAKAPYLPNENLSTTLCSGDLDNSHVLITFLGGVDLAAGDELLFYDGTDATAPLIVRVDANTPKETFTVRASNINPSGCITVVFTSDDQEEGAGWIGSVSCQTRCQELKAELLSTLPAALPTDTGWIDICAGDEVQFAGRGDYPQNNDFYQQSDQTSTFTWLFGDGSSATGQQVSHVYRKSGGYLVQLVVEDTLGCKSTNFIKQRVRVAPTPDFSITAGTPDICLGDTLDLSGSISAAAGTSFLTVLPDTSSFVPGGIRADSLPLPDGNGVAYETSIQLNQFEPGQLLTSLDDLVGICMNIEHSYMGDLAISISCPDGSTVALHNFLGQVGEYLIGEPNDLDGETIVPGNGLDYCWTPNAPNGTWEDFVIANPAPDSLPPGSYEPIEALDPLLGCPLNGEWTIRVEDRLLEDNGFIFNWSIEFSEDLFPDLEVFSPELVDGFWQDDPIHISQYSATEIIAKPAYPGNVYYTYTVEDEFGCFHDTSLVVRTLPPTDPACQSCQPGSLPPTDTVICAGQSWQPDLSQQTLGQEEVRFGTNPGQTFPPGRGTQISSGIPVTGIAPATIGDPALSIVSVCVNLETERTGDMELVLESPDGRQLLLFENRGGNGDDLQQTCFSPLSNTPLNSATAPFTGTFDAEGDWDILVGSTVNGNWKLILTDEGEDDPKVLESWTITFRSSGQKTYSWSPATGLSCVDCPDPVIQVDNDISYAVEITDSFGCLFRDTINIQVAPAFPPPTITVQQINGQDLLFEWPGLPPGTEFEYRVIQDGTAGPWQGPTTQTQLLLPALPAGTRIRLEVKQSPASFSPECPPEAGSAEVTVIGCALVANPPQVRDICAGETTGSIDISPGGANGQVTFELLPGGATNTSGTFTGLPVGSYRVRLVDEIGCTDSVDFELTTPPASPLEITLVVEQDVKCAGEATGRVSSTVTGGQPAYTYEWLGLGQNGPVADQVPGGNTTLVVTDTRGCTDTATIVVPQPPAITINSFPVQPSCPQSTDGELSMAVNGGLAPYTLEWEDGSTGPSRTNLGEGIYCLTVTDGAGCQAQQCDTLRAPDPVSIDSFVVREVSCYGGQDGSVQTVISGGSAPYAFQWNDPGGQTNSLASGLPAGTYTLEVQDDRGCLATAQVEIPQPDSLQLALLTRDVGCKGDSTGSITATAEGGTAPYTFAWFNGETGPEINDLPAGNWQLTLTDDRGCQLQAEVPVNEPDSALQADLLQIRQGCAGSSNDNSVTVLIGGRNIPMDYNFLWSNGQTDSVLTGLAPGPISVEVTDENGCTAQSEMELENLEPITFTIQGRRPSCPGESDGSLAVTIISGGNGQEITDYNYQWSTGDQGPVVTGLSGGQVYSVTVTDDQGCTATSDRFLAAPAPLTYELDLTDVSCAGGSDGSAAVTNVEAESGVYTIRWDEQAGGLDSPEVTGLRAGTYEVTLTDINNCTLTKSFTIGEPDTLQIALDVTDNRCFGDDRGRIEARITGGTPEYMLQWSNGSTDNTIANLDPGTYLLTVEDSRGCTAVDSARISDPVPIELEVFVEEPSCFGAADAVVSLSASGGAPPYRFGLGPLNLGPDNTFTGLSAGTYQATVADSLNCRVTQSTLVPEPPPLTVDAGPEILTIAPGDTAQLNATILNAEGEVELFWVAPQPITLSCLQCTDPLAYPTFTTTYEVNIRDGRGCIGRDLITVQVSKRDLVAVPTGFSPNGDGNNDRLVVHGKNGLQVQVFRLFDRWGNLVYENGEFPVNEESSGWDGRIGNEQAPVGVYIWVLEVSFPDGTSQTLNGHTKLIR